VESEGFANLKRMGVERLLDDILAIKTAADTAGISGRDFCGIFFDNGISLLRMVRGKKQILKIKEIGKCAYGT
jgi:hypothetical protein